MKTPIYSSPYRGTRNYLLAYYSDGGRKRESAATLEAGGKRAKELIEELAQGREAHQR